MTKEVNNEGLEGNIRFHPDTRIVVGEDLSVTHYSATGGIRFHPDTILKVNEDFSVTYSPGTGGIIIEENSPLIAKIKEMQKSFE